MNRITRHPILSAAADRRLVSFSFDGKRLEGYEGEALSSSLAAAGIEVFSRHARDGGPQGLFCANGQCSQCSVLVNGRARKACVTPLEEGMELATLEGLPELPPSDLPFSGSPVEELSADVLVIGGGPAGLAAARELALLGLSVVLADDKSRLGGKLVLQTHKFFGSEADCGAGSRGIEIAKRLEGELRELESVRILADSPVVALFKDRKAGVYLGRRAYALVGFRGLLVAAGAREKSLLVPGAELPGVYGAGAFQTLVNRDLVRPSRRVLVVGSGNVGLIAAYHALQAGIEVAGIVEVAPRVGGYAVHADKIRRLGVPIYLRTGLVAVEGRGQVERALIASVDSKFEALPGTTRSLEVDSVLVATGLSPCDEFYRQARDFGFMTVAAGDAEEIAEASSATFGGRIAALCLARMMGSRVSIDESWIGKHALLKSRPGDRIEREGAEIGREWRPVFFCEEEIPCDPCVSVCPSSAIRLRRRKGSIMDLPYYEGQGCRGCAACVASCPGLAISLVRAIDADWAELLLPYEFLADFEAGERLSLVDKGGAFLEEASLIGKTFFGKQRTWVLDLRVSRKNAARAIGVRVRGGAADSPPALSADLPPSLADEAFVCRCERVTVGEMKRFIRENGVRDINQLKSLRIGMGACGSKTCSSLIPRVFASMGIEPEGLAETTRRPLAMEVSLSALAGEMETEVAEEAEATLAGRKGAGA
jgi:NADPH-dependent 2,4-dienoyl-CoA reductase/sulfur reductase-like enzyme/Pyruvate/2-oxoacid:ferredoxin oxidoreductase delta subunit